MTKPATVPLIFILFTTFLCVSLGMWQLKRLAWKETLIEQTQNAATLPSLGTLPVNDAEISTLAFRSASLTGMIDSAHLLRFIGQKSSGYVWYAPLKLEDSDHVVLVAMSWLPANEEPKLDSGLITLDGILREPRARRLFSPENQPEKNLWFTEDMQAIRTQTGLNFVPLVLDTKGAPALRNDHLGYAITWFLLAAVGIVMFIIYHRAPKTPA